MARDEEKGQLLLMIISFYNSLQAKNTIMVFFPVILLFN